MNLKQIQEDIAQGEGLHREFNPSFALNSRDPCKYRLSILLALQNLLI